MSDPQFTKARADGLEVLAAAGSSGAFIDTTTGVFRSRRDDVDDIHFVNARVAGWLTREGMARRAGAHGSGRLVITEKGSEWVGFMEGVFA